MLVNASLASALIAKPRPSVRRSSPWARGGCPERRAAVPVSTVDEAKLALRADAERDGDNAQHDPSGSHENDP